MKFNKIYTIAILALTLIILSLMLVDYMMGVKTVKVSYVPKKELADLAKTIDYVDKEEIEVATAKVEEKKIVFDGLTLDELANKLERSLNSDLKGYGYKFASYATSLGLDPYLCLAIALEETGCTWGCSSLVTSCNNIGGQKGSGCGAYQSFSSLDAGIEGFLNNIYKNYYRYGLTTADTMHHKYAENPLWARNVNAYITKIKNK